MALVLDGSAGVSGVDGTASNPSYEGTDSNTGIFFPAADTVAIGTGGTEALRVNSSQNVGIGTTSQTAALDVVKPSFSGGPLIGARFNTSNFRMGFGVGNSNGFPFLGVNVNNAANDNGTFDINGYASRLRLENGVFQVQTSSASGTAGGAITWTTPLTLDASGNFGLGTSTPTISGNAFTTLNVRGVASNTGLITVTSNDLASSVQLYSGQSTSDNPAIGYQKNLRFGTTSDSGIQGFTERARITIGGYFKASNTGTYNVAAGTFHELRSDSSDFTLVVDCTRASGTQTSVLLAQNVNANTATYLYSGRNGSATDVFRVAANGNVTNTNNSYGIISDIKVKENIVDATPKLEKLMQVRVVNYNLKGDLGYETNKQIGVIAQELEQVFPSLVENNPDYDEDGNDLGTITKSVKMSVFVPMLIKAIQEQQAMIDEMKAEIAALKAQP